MNQSTFPNQSPLSFPLLHSSYLVGLGALVVPLNDSEFPRFKRAPGSIRDTLVPRSDRHVTALDNVRAVLLGGLGKGLVLLSLRGMRVDQKL